MEIVATGAAPLRHTYDGLIATSAHALELLGDVSRETLRAIPLHVVGERTHKAARAFALNTANASSKNSAHLSAVLRAQAALQSRFLYLAGRDRKPGLEAELREANHHVESLIVYDAHALAALPDAAIAALQNSALDAVLHYSRRSAALFLELSQKAGVSLANLQHICISADAATPLLAAGLSTRIAPTPDSQGLFTALESV